MNHVLDQYYAGKISLAIAAEGIQRDLASLWMGLATADQRGRVGGRGNDQETDRERATLERAETVVLTTTGFLALDQLGLLDIVNESFERVIVTRSVQDDVQCARALNSSHAGRGFFGKFGGEFVFSEYPEEYFVMVQELYGRLTELVATQEMVPVWERLKVAPDERQLVDTMDEALGASAVDAAMLARTSGYLIIEDDMVTREVLHATWGVESTSIQSLIAHLHATDRITDEIRNASLERLAVAGYKFLRVDRNFFEWLTLKTDASARSSFSAAVTYLQPPCTAQSAGVLAAQIAREVWLGRHTVERRRLVLYEIAAALKSHERDEALDVFEHAIPHVFGDLLALQAVKAVRVLREWRAAIG